MERLGEVTGFYLRISCKPCNREGRYQVAKLVAEHGAGLSLDVLRLRMSQRCRWQRSEGAREPGKYYPKCQARLILPTGGGSGGFESFRPGGAVFKVDVWLPDDSGIEHEILLAKDLQLAIQWYGDVVAKYPGRNVTLRQRAHVLRTTALSLPHGTGGW